MTCDTNIRSYMMKGMVGGTTTLEELISSCTVDALEALDDASLASFAPPCWSSGRDSTRRGSGSSPW